MYARHFSFKSTPEKRPEIEALADRALNLMQTMTGFVAAHFFVSEDETTYGSVSFWQSKDDLAAAASQLTNATLPVAEKLATDAPIAMTYEVYEPKI